MHDRPKVGVARKFLRALCPGLFSGELGNYADTGVDVYGKCIVTNFMR
jgi:hypothetical protein